MSEQKYGSLIKRFPFCDPSRRHDFVMFFDVRGGNPNGDPDAGNLPRMDPSTRRGVVTDVCTKRKVRDYLARELGRPIFIQSEAALNTLYARVARELAEAGDEEVQKAYAEAEFGPIQLKDAIKPKGKNGTDPTDEQAAEARAWLERLDIEGFDVEPGENPSTDVRVAYIGEISKAPDFRKAMNEAAAQSEDAPEWADRLHNAVGKALAKGKVDLTKGARDKIKRGMCKEYDDIRMFGAVLTFGTNAGQVRGPIQITFGRSIDPIVPQEAAITRCAITKQSDRARKQTEFGRKSWLNYAIYRQHGFFNPSFAKLTTLDALDLLRFWVALCKCHDAHRSASSGEQRMQQLVVFTHESHRGNAPSHKLLDPVQVRRLDDSEPTGVFDLDFETVVRTGADKNAVVPFAGDRKHEWPQGVVPYQPLNHLSELEAELESLTSKVAAG